MTTEMRGRAPAGWRRRASQRAIDVTRLQPCAASFVAGESVPLGRMLVAGSEPPDHVEGRTASALVNDDRHADAEEPPEEDLDRRVVERVEVAHRNEEAEPGGEDRPEEKREPAIAHRRAAAADR